MRSNSEQNALLMKSIVLFKWNWTKETNKSILMGGLMILLSLAMIPFKEETFLNNVIKFILRDLLMIFELGISFVTFYCNKYKCWEKLGITNKKIKLSLILNLVLAILLLSNFLSKKRPEGILNINNFYAAFYIITAGVFEMLFIYGYLRMSFQESFGIIPSIILTSIFYSFHHAGFQAEFLKLFFVGNMYMSVFYITSNLFIIFPFFWGIGALWDVIIDSKSGNSIKNFNSFVIAILIWLLSILCWIYLKRKKNFQMKGKNN